MTYRRSAAARGRRRAENVMSSSYFAPPPLGWDEELGIPVTINRADVVNKCLRGTDRRPCSKLAGQGTDHPGLGACLWHERSVEEKALGAWMMAHVIARTLDISPWDALLLAVRRAATWAAFYDMKLAEVDDDDALRPGGAAYDWVLAAERVNDKMARYSKMAVDAGVAAMIVQTMQNEGAAMARVLNAALSAVELTGEQETAMRAAMRRALLELEGASGV